MGNGSVIRERVRVSLRSMVIQSHAANVSTRPIAGSPAAEIDRASARAVSQHSLLRHDAQRARFAQRLLRRRRIGARVRRLDGDPEAIDRRAFESFGVDDGGESLGDRSRGRTRRTRSARKREWWFLIREHPSDGPLSFEPHARTSACSPRCPWCSWSSCFSSCASSFTSDTGTNGICSPPPCSPRRARESDDASDLRVPRRHPARTLHGSPRDAPACRASRRPSATTSDLVCSKRRREGPSRPTTRFYWLVTTGTPKAAAIDSPFRQSPHRRARGAPRRRHHADDPMAARTEERRAASATVIVTITLSESTRSIARVRSRLPPP